MPTDFSRKSGFVMKWLDRPVKILSGCSFFPQYYKAGILKAFNFVKNFQYAFF